MKIKNIFPAIFVAAICLGAIGRITAQESVAATRRVNSKVVHITGASDVLFSRSGKYLIIKGDWKFYILPTGESLSESVLMLDKARSMDNASAIGFTPSDKVVFTNF
jgi:hypothetical protein